MKMITNTLKKYDMFSKKEKIVVGLSGGADSVMLTHYLKYNTNVKVIAVHINHMIRDGENLIDKEFVKNFCQNHKINCYFFDIDVLDYAKKHKISTELAGREVRYNCFLKVALEHSCNIATAHTLSDNVETLIFNLIRGTGIVGLCGIQAKRLLEKDIYVVRPILNCTRDEIEQYCGDNNLSFQTDSTNLELDYTRNKIRNKIIPIFYEINQSFNTNIKNTINILNTQKEYIDKEVCKLINDCVMDNKIDLSKIKGTDKALLTEVLIKYLKENNIDANFNQIEILIDEMDTKNYKLSINKDKYVTIKNGYLYLQHKKLVEFYEDLCVINSKYLSKCGNLYEITVTNAKNTKKIQKINKNDFYICINYDKIYGELFFRQKLTNDKITLEKRNCTKTLKKLFNELSYDAHEKSEIFVLATKENLIAVENIGVNKEYLPDDNTKNFLVIKKIKGE